MILVFGVVVYLLVELEKCLRGYMLQGKTFDLHHAHQHASAIDQRRDGLTKP
jgi:hypothetical protein